MPKVFIVNNSGHDFSEAEKFGTLVCLSEGRMSPFAINKMYRQFADIMEDSDSQDYILMSGLPQMNIVASSIFAYMHGRLNLLIFSSKHNDYERREIILGNLLTEKTEKDEH